MIAPATAQLAREHVGLCHREPRAFAGEEETQAAASPISALRPWSSGPSDLADPVEIESAPPAIAASIAAIPTPCRRRAGQRRPAFLVRRRGRVGQVLVAEDEEEERPVIAHGDRENLPSRFS